jgi:hypothetical protein
MARLWVYHRPPRGGRGKCRRACERTPLRGRRRCAAGGRRLGGVIRGSSAWRPIDMQYKAAKNEVQNMQIYFGQGLVFSYF